MKSLISWKFILYPIYGERYIYVQYIKVTASLRGKKKDWPNEVFTRIKEEMDLSNTAAKNEKHKTSQAVQWLGLQVLTAQGAGSIPGKLRSHSHTVWPKLEEQVWLVQTRIWWVSTRLSYDSHSALWVTEVKTTKTYTHRKNYTQMFYQLSFPIVKN